MSSAECSDRRELSSQDFERVLRLHHTDLRETLNLQELIPLMRKCDLLTVEECQEIESKPSDSKKTDQLVQVLPRKGKLACHKFIRCLESEKQHLGHPELVLKLKETVAKFHSQLLDTTVRTDQESTMNSATFVKQFTDSLLSVLNGKDDIIKQLQKRIADLEAQLQQANKQISDLLSHVSSHASHTQIHAVSTVAEFQQLQNYVNGEHGSQLSPNCNTRALAKHYQHVNSVMKKARRCLKEDAEYVNQCINTNSEESDGIRSRTSSVDSESQLHRGKISPCTKSPSEEVLEEEAAEMSDRDSEEDSYSSADETDDEILDTNLEPEQEQEIVLRLKSQHQQRPESYAAYKERRASKINSWHSVSSTVHLRNGSTTDSDANDDKQEALAGFDVGSSEQEIHQIEDNNLACSTVELSSIDDHEEPSPTILAGYLHTEGTGPHDRWKKRYFTLIKEFLYYSKSRQDSRVINGFPLVGLELERKKKNTFELINKQASNIKVNKPGKECAQIASYRVIKLKASSERETQKWIDSIKSAIAMSNSQYHPRD